MGNLPVKIMLFSLFMVFSFSCKDNKDDDNLTQVPNDVTGQWEFIITPDHIYQDTDLIKGHRASDFEVYSSITDEVYLYQSGENILGFTGPCKLSGRITGKQVTLNVLIDPDGKYLPERPIEEMNQLSIINLLLDDYHMMQGTGTYMPYETYPPIVNNTYKVKARRTNTINVTKQSLSGFKSGMAVSDWKNDICKILFSIVSWIITDLTDGIVRPMSSECWLSKDGGGYYVFGQEGPGSMFPIFTQNIYYPFEWSACQVRDYSFNISIGSENISYLVLKNSIINSPPVKDLISKLGFTGVPQLEQALDDFYNQFGGFGISIYYDTETNGLGLYVNISQGNSDDAINSGLVQCMKAAFGQHVGSIDVLAGTSINDNWHLRRSPAFVCNSPIIICYVIGTNNVQYN